MVDRLEQGAFVAKRKKEALSAIDSHTAKLHELEAVFGFDLDVATDIYGVELLDPRPEHVAVVEKWHTLLTAVGENPGQPLVLARIDQKLRPGCYGFGKEAEYDSFLVLAACSGVEPADIVYEKGDEAADGVIKIAQPSLTTDYTGHAAAFVPAPELALAQTVPPQARVFDRSSHWPLSIEDGTEVFYNPTAPDIYGFLRRSTFRGGEGLIAHRHVEELVDTLALPFNQPQT